MAGHRSGAKNDGAIALHEDAGTVGFAVIRTRAAGDRTVGNRPPADTERCALLNKNIATGRETTAPVSADSVASAEAANSLGRIIGATTAAVAAVSSTSVRKRSSSSTSEIAIFKKISASPLAKTVGSDSRTGYAAKTGVAAHAAATANGAIQRGRTAILPDPTGGAIMIESNINQYDVPGGSRSIGNIIGNEKSAPKTGCATAPPIISRSVATLSNSMADLQIFDSDTAGVDKQTAESVVPAQSMPFAVDEDCNAWSENN